MSDEIDKHPATDMQVQELCEQLHEKVNTLLSAVKALLDASLIQRQDLLRKIICDTPGGEQVLRDLESLVDTTFKVTSRQEEIEYRKHCALMLMMVFVFMPEDAKSDLGKWERRRDAPTIITFLSAPPLFPRLKGRIIELRRPGFFINWDARKKYRQIEKFVNSRRQDIETRFNEEDAKLNPHSLYDHLKAGDNPESASFDVEELQRLGRQVYSQLEQLGVLPHVYDEDPESGRRRLDETVHEYKYFHFNVGPVPEGKVLNTDYLESLATAVLGLRQTLNVLRNFLLLAQPVMEEEIDLPMLVTPKMLALLGVGDQER